MQRPFANLTRRGQSLRIRQLAIAALGVEYVVVDPRVRRLSMGSFNSVFRVDHSGHQTMFRVGDACRIHPVGVEDVEAAWLRDLADSGFVVPVNIATTDGASHTVVDHPGVPEPRTCSMFTWVKGVRLAQRLSAESMMAAGVLLAELHEHAASDTTEPVAADVRADRVVYLHSKNRVLTHGSRHGTLLVEAIDRIQRLLDELWRSPPHRPHLLHGDFGPNNILNWRGQLQPIDFQDLQFGFDLQDVALTCADLKRNYPDMVDPFKAGYASVRGWPELSPELEQALAAARSLNLMNLGLHLRRPGTEQYLEAHANRVVNWMNTT